MDPGNASAHPPPPACSAPSSPTPPSRRYIYALPMGCALVALILGLILVFSGTQDNFMAKHDILTLKTNKVRAGDLTGQSAGLSGFYSVHVFGYCQGSLVDGVDKDIKRCSTPHGLFSFNIRESLQHDAKQSSHSLADLKWPTAIDVIFESFALRFKVMMVLYIIGLFATLAAFLCGCFEVFMWTSTHPDLVKAVEERTWGSLTAIDETSAEQRSERNRAFYSRMKEWRINTHEKSLMLLQKLAYACAGSSALACVALLIASTIVTDASLTTAAVVNKYGRHINISATAGLSFMIMSWTATVFMLLAPLAWMSTPMRSWLSNELKRVECDVEEDEKVIADTMAWHAAKEAQWAQQAAWQQAQQAAWHQAQQGAGQQN